MKQSLAFASGTVPQPATAFHSWHGGIRFQPIAEPRCHAESRCHFWVSLDSSVPTAPTARIPGLHIHASFHLFPHQTICMAQGRRPTTSRKFNLPANLKYLCPIAGKICKVTNKSTKRLSRTRILQDCSEAGLLEIGLRY